MGRIKNILQRLKFEANTLVSELHSDCVPVNSYAWMNYDGSIDHSNWGDDINWYFLKEIISGHLISYDHARLTKLFHRPNYVVIGSTIDLRANADSIIWGAGIIDSNTSCLPQFKEIRAVRGPYTRKKLMELGFKCPEVYGDPALLIPLHYHPSIDKRFRLGIIPHFHDYDRVKAQIQNLKNVKLIDIRHYNHWHGFVDEILSCESIASSSLHGLIVSEAFKIPNIWIEFRDGISRDHFKYHDFFASVGKTVNPVLISGYSDALKIEESLSGWMPGELDLRPLIDCSPFKLRL